MHNQLSILHKKAIFVLFAFTKVIIAIRKVYIGTKRRTHQKKSTKDLQSQTTTSEKQVMLLQ